MMINVDFLHYLKHLNSLQRPHGPPKCVSSKVDCPPLFKTHPLRNPFQKKTSPPSHQVNTHQKAANLACSRSHPQHKSVDTVSRQARRAFLHVLERNDLKEWWMQRWVRVTFGLRLNILFSGCRKGVLFCCLLECFSRKESLLDLNLTRGFGYSKWVLRLR